MESLQETLSKMLEKKDEWTTKRNESVTTPDRIRYQGRIEGLHYALGLLDGQELVHDNRKYYVMDQNDRMLLVRMLDGVTITIADPFPFEELYPAERRSHALTEKEIKSYDSKYMIFARPKEEVNAFYDCKRY